MSVHVAGLRVESKTKEMQTKMNKESERLRRRRMLKKSLIESRDVKSVKTFHLQIEPPFRTNLYSAVRPGQACGGLGINFFLG